MISKHANTGAEWIFDPCLQSGYRITNDEEALIDIYQLAKIIF